MQYKRTVLLMVFMFLFSLLSKSQEKYYQYSKPTHKDKVNLDLITEFEIGFHAGKNWTLGSTNDFARTGHVYSLNIGWNNSKFYGGTEFSLKYWDEILSDKKANEADFNQKQFLWLVHMKWYITKGDVQPFLGVGTDLLSIAEGILNPKDKDDENYHRNLDEDRFLNYNAWFVPTIGVRFKLKDKLFTDITYALDHSDNYDSMRLQIGISYQPQF